MAVGKLFKLVVNLHTLIRKFVISFQLNEPWIP